MAAFSSPRVSLEFCRKQAKALRRAHGAGDPDALARIGRSHPQYRNASSADIANAPISLRDAQLVIAREQGFDGWTRLKEAVEIADVATVRVAFWGTRGTTTLSGDACRAYGGYTPCVTFEVEGGGSTPERPGRIILDAGTGLRSLVREIQGVPEAERPAEYHVLLSHLHVDHVEGVRTFAPLFTDGAKVVFYGQPIEELPTAVDGLFVPPYSPLKGVRSLAADVRFRRAPLRTQTIAGLQVKACRNRHSTDCLSYRVQYGPFTLVYSTDHEPGDAETDAALVSLARDADVWILDGQWTDEEYAQRRGWGHSSYRDTVKLGCAAGVSRLVLFHHDPSHDDEFLDGMGREATASAAGTPTRVLMARDNMCLRLPEA